MRFTRTIMRSSSRGVPLAASFAVALMGLAFVGAAQPRDSVAQDVSNWKVVYDHYDTRIGECCAGIDAINSETRRPRALIRRSRGSNTSYWPYAFSPDGNHVAYGRFPGGLHLMRADGTDRRRLAADANVNDVLWSSDGLALVFVVGRARVDVVGADGRGRRTLFRTPRSDIELQDVSLGGNRVLVLVRTASDDRLYSISTVNGARRLLVRAQHQQLGGASWSSDGRLVAFKRRCEDGRGEDIYCDVAVMRIDGTSIRTVLRHESAPIHGPSDDAPTWLPKTSRLVVAEWGFGADTRRIDTRTGSSRIIAKKPWRSATASTDGNTIGSVYDVSGGGMMLGLARPDGTIVGRRELPFGLSTGHDLWVS
jgi:WD40 repeat protein